MKEEYLIGQTVNRSVCCDERHLMPQDESSQQLPASQLPASTRLTEQARQSVSCVALNCAKRHPFAHQRYFSYGQSAIHPPLAPNFYRVLTRSIGLWFLAQQSVTSSSRPDLRVAVVAEYFALDRSTSTVQT
jgi:hypothetical protein